MIKVFVKTTNSITYACSYISKCPLLLCIADVFRVLGTISPEFFHALCRVSCSRQLNITKSTTINGFCFLLKPTKSYNAINILCQTVHNFLYDGCTGYTRMYAACPHCWSTTWWRHQMETFPALLALCASEFPSQRPVTRSFDVFFDLRLNKRLTKRSRRMRFETPPCLLWRHSNETCSVSEIRFLRDFDGSGFAKIGKTLEY